MISDKEEFKILMIPYPKFTMGCAAQENRHCRAFSVTYTNQ